MKVDAQSIRNAALRRLPAAERFLVEMIRVPSLSGSEAAVTSLIARRFAALGLTVERIPLSDALRRDPDYSSPIPHIRYAGRSNLRIIRKGAGKGRSVIINTHLDVVPVSSMRKAVVSAGRIHGPGACDAKGQIATIWLLSSLLNDLALPLAGDLEIHLVVEEEIGGNGTLAMVRRGYTADACIVMEPTELKVSPAIRGAVWFRLDARGASGHSSQTGQTRSALATVREAMIAIEELHQRLVRKSRGLPLFNRLPAPMPLTFGKLQSGLWPAAIPATASLEGVMGFLPNMTKEVVCRGMRAELARRLGDRFRRDCSLSFTYRHDSSMLDRHHRLPAGLAKAGKAFGHSLEIAAMPASCDAWLYRNKLRIPTVVFGPGSLGVAHSPSEFIARKDLAMAGAILAHFLIGYSG